MRRREEGRFVVTGPGIDRSSGHERAALSMASGWASRQTDDCDVLVREIGKQRPVWIVSKRGRQTSWVRG